MGMYTEIFVNVDFKSDTPATVIETIKAMCSLDHESEWLQDKPSRWSMLFNNGSYYTPCTSVSNMTLDEISNQWSLLGKGDIKNYDNEIESFFEYIKPHCENKFIGYSRYEESDEPVLYYS